MLEDYENRNKELFEENLNLKNENEILTKKLKKLADEILSKQIKSSYCDSASTNDTIQTEINPNVSLKFTSNPLLKTSLFETKSLTTKSYQTPHNRKLIYNI